MGEVFSRGVEGGKEGGFSCSTCVSALGPRVGCEVPLPEKQHGNCTLDPQTITNITCQSWCEKTKPLAEPVISLKVRVPTCRLAPHGEVNIPTTVAAVGAT